MKDRCLILNLSWFPIAIEGIEDTLIRLFNQGNGYGKTFVIDESIIDGQTYYQRYSIEDWVDKGIDKNKPVIRTAKFSFQYPEVVMKSCNNVHVSKLSVKSSYIFDRDGHKCWYCGSKAFLTLDHIIPQCKGGKTTWKNVITSCKKCNLQKGDKDVIDFCIMKNCEIPTPKNVGSFPWLRYLGNKYPKSWDKWLDF